MAIHIKGSFVHSNHFAYGTWYFFIKDTFEYEKGKRFRHTVYMR